MLIIAASKASSDTIFNESQTCVPADSKNPVRADIIGSQMKMLWAGWQAGWLAMDDYPSAILAHSKMAVIVCNTGIPFVLYLLGQTK